MKNTDPRTRRRRLLTGGAVAVLAAAAFAGGLLVSRDSSERDAVERFAEAWQEGEFAAMHAELTDEAQSRISVEQLESAYARAARTATVVELELGSPRGPIDHRGETVVALPIEVRTEAFGVISGAELAVPVVEGGIDWRESLVFPGLEPGDELERRARAPRRAAILARDRSRLAEGAADERGTNHSGGILTGELGAPPTERDREMRREGFPEGTLAGNSGLELAFDGRLAGRPGGRLLAVSEQGDARRVLAEAEPERGRPVRTTIDPELQEATVAALGARFGGVAVLDARNGEILALAGLAFSAPRAPGSSFKIITTVAGLEEGATDTDHTYPVLTEINAGGRAFRNADRAACGGTLAESFADSCNTVFAPLGVEIGGERLLEVAERFGFNSPPALYADEALAATQPPSSSIPDPIGAEVDVAATAIGQGRVQSTPLQMASVAQVIANDGVRSPTSLVKTPELRSDEQPVPVTGSQTATVIRELMVEVVESGTGTPAALADVTVAGKTGTAEVGPVSGEPVTAPGEEPEMELDAWFTAFAPAERPRLAVAVMVVDAGGGGGAIAAPIAREVLQAGLGQ